MSKSKSIKSNVIYEDGFFMGEKDIKIYYKSYEVEDSEDVIVISHGFCESSEKYRELIKTFNKNNYSVYIIDHRGHGKSGRLGIDNSQINVEDFNYYIKDLKTFLDSIVVPNLNDRKLYLFAHSMGGAIGALFLEKHNNYFEKAINHKSYYLKDPDFYSSDKWYDDQDNRKFIKNRGCIVINEGKAEGIIIGGNLCSFNLLQGTPYMPNLKDKILFIEDDALVGKEFPYEFDRNLVSLIQQKDFDKVKGIVIGRSQTQTGMNLTKWKKILHKKELKNIPIIINANFGHTTPNATIPIGGNCIINTYDENKIFIQS